jgi:ribose transport system permease protein
MSSSQQGGTTTAEKSAPAPRVSDGSGAGRPGIAQLATRYSMVGVLVLLVIVASILYPGFLNPANIGNILTPEMSEWGNPALVMECHPGLNT